VADKPTVFEALNAVMAELPGITKSQKADPAQGGYAYRGIEQITEHTQRLFAKHGIVFIPSVIDYEVIDIMVRTKPWTDTRLMIVYEVFGPTGDSLKVGPIIGIGRDNSDKGANKAMTQALKYALLQVFQIGDKASDADGTSTEADATVNRTLADIEIRRDLQKRAMALQPEQRDSLIAQLKTEGVPSFKDMSNYDVAVAERFFEPFEPQK